MLPYIGETTLTYGSKVNEEPLAAILQGHITKLGQTSKWTFFQGKLEQRRCDLSRIEP